MKVTTDGCLFGAWTTSLVAQQTTATTILDIGTGTGLLSLMLAQQTTATITGIEIEAAAAQQAGQNFQASPWPAQLQVIQTDIKLLPATGYDIIISNPPFYENDLRSAAGSKNLAHHDAGLLLYDLIAIIKRQLNNNGLFFLLLPYKREQEVLQLLQQQQLFPLQITRVKQTEKHGYFRSMIAGTHQANNLPLTENIITIRDQANHYTDDFSRLLQAYYLHL